MKKMNSNEMLLKGGWSPCDSWWGCTAFSIGIGFAAGAVSGGFAAWAGGAMGDAACSYICSKS